MDFKWWPLCPGFVSDSETGCANRDVNVLSETHFHSGEELGVV
jgi:hypothetical protein